MEKCKKTFSLKRQRSSEKLKDETEEDKENIAPVSNADSPKASNENNGNLIDFTSNFKKDILKNK